MHLLGTQTRARLPSYPSAACGNVLAMSSLLGVMLPTSTFIFAACLVLEHVAEYHNHVQAHHNHRAGLPLLRTGSLAAAAPTLIVRGSR